MSLRTRVLRLVEIVLRVPPLFVIDEILKIGLVISDFAEHDLSGFEDGFEEAAGNASTATLTYDPTVYRLLVAALVRFAICMLGEHPNQTIKRHRGLVHEDGAFVRWIGNRMCSSSKKFSKVGQYCLRAYHYYLIGFS